ncbi:MAG: peptide chain release factor N(5)-glutamine methyltransferase [Eggerthellaceae bacterium]|nr:peptide chain release factor N(5)-glutamine methyltransferase [Eggerthellaceae bacterium]
MSDGGTVWTIKAALDWTVGYLGRKGDVNPRVSAEWLLAEATGMRRIELYLDLDRPLSLSERDVLRSYVRRRGAGEPLQYITGETGFRHIMVKVRPGVLIPRPETEVLVSEALRCISSREKRTDHLALASQEDETARDAAESDPSSFADEVDAEERGVLVADIGTGTGCIACSIAYELPTARVIATDISPDAVALARENVEALGLEGRVTVVECDLGEGIELSYLGAFDLLISNPPYIPTSVLADIPSEVADFEPALALDGGDDGLDVFRRLLLFCGTALKPGGLFAFELHETCLDDAARQAREMGFSEVRIVEDLTRRPRVLLGRLPFGATI